MPKSTNMVLAAGHLARDAEIRYTATGKQVAQCCIAASENWESKDGEKKESTTFIEVTAWGGLAERLQEARKGDYVYVVGKLKTDSWEDKTTQQKRYKTYVNAEMVNLTPKKAPEPEPAPATSTRGQLQQPQEAEDDIPF
jgi:single-strand DNA-binding protein